MKRTKTKASAKKKSKFKFKDQAKVVSGFYGGRIVTILSTEPQIEAVGVVVPPTCMVRFESGNIGYIFEKYLRLISPERADTLKKRNTK